LGSPFTIAIPTINSSGWIGAVYRYYKALDVEPIFFVDARSEDTTLSRLRWLGARTVTLENNQLNAEPMIRKIRGHIETSWVLRVDDDECPSAALLEWTARAINNGYLAHDMAAFPRRWLRFNSWNVIGYASSLSWDSTGEDRQFRLYRKEKVKYCPDIHTPGFQIERADQAPSNCVLYHFHWILRSKAEREEKMRRYDAQREGAGTDCAKFYLPENVKHWDFEEIVRDQLVRRLASAMRRDRRTRRIRTIFSRGGVLAN